MFLEPIWKPFSFDINLLLLSANPKVTGSISPDVLHHVLWVSSSRHMNSVKTFLFIVSYYAQTATVVQYMETSHGWHLSTLKQSTPVLQYMETSHGWHLSTLTHKVRLSCNTGNIPWVAPLYTNTQSTPVLQYREHPMGGTSVLHSNYTGPAIQWTCPGGRLSVLHTNYTNTGNLPWVAPLHYTQTTPVLQDREPLLGDYLL